MFSTEELKLEYQRLKFVSKEWTRKDKEDIRKTMNHLILSSPDKSMEQNPV